MTWVKVCGLREPNHIELAIELGADAIGLVMAEVSPRNIDLETATRLAGRAEGVDSFLVTADADPDWVLATARSIGVTGVQPHGEGSEEASAMAAEAGFKVLRPVPVDGPVSVDHVPLDQIPILDTARAGLHGGTGERWDGSLLGSIERRWVLAGGLNADNVAEAVAELRPWGVDASSGLESSPGQKDPARIRSFIEEARAT